MQQQNPAQKPGQQQQQSPEQKTQKEVQSSKKEVGAPPPRIPGYIVRLGRLHFYEKCEVQGQFTCSYRAKLINGRNAITVFAKILIDVKEELVKNYHEAAKSAIALRHPHIVNFIGLVPGEAGPFVAIFDYCPGRTLMDHLLLNQACLSWPCRLRIAIECADALDYLGQHNAVYRYMSARNVILGDHDFTSKLTDFNFIRPNKGDQLQARWMAPEVLKRYHFTTQSDIWAYGVFLTELFLDGKNPYPELLEHEVIEKLTDGSLHRMEIPVFLPEPLRAAIKQCWEETPEKRPGISVVRKKIATLL